MKRGASRGYLHCARAWILLCVGAMTMAAAMHPP
jgi:hypothetical protein